MTQVLAIGVLPSRSLIEVETTDQHWSTRTFTQKMEDQRLADQVETSLHATGYSQLRAVAISVCDRLVILRGRVCSYYLKQIAQETALAVLGVRGIHNQLKVKSPN